MIYYHKILIALLSLSAVALNKNPASAEIQSISGDIEIVDSPSSVRRNHYEHTDLARLFPEISDVETDSVTINAVLPGRYDAYADFQDAVIDTPQPFNTFFFHFDPIGNEEGFVDGSITFTQRILGVIGRSLTMQQTDSTLGAIGTLYPTNRFDREPEYASRGNYDYFELANDMRTLTFHLRATDIDQLRIVVAAVPEPSSLLLILLTLLCSVACRNCGRVVPAC